MKKLLAFLLALVILAPVTGELWRLPLMGLEFLPSDLLIPLLFVVWAADKIHSDRKIRLGKIGKSIFIFLFVLITTYLLNLFRFDTTQMITAFSYLGRFAMYIILAIIAFDLLDRDKDKYFYKVILGSFFVSFVLITILGFLQLKYFGNFFELGMYLKGWDPHIGRLLSTWFDPNYVGGYLSFMLSIAIAVGLYCRKTINRKWFIVFGIVCFMGLIAIYLTYSRSAYLALIASLGVLAFLKSRKLLVVAALAITLGFAFSPRVQQRFMDMWGSVRVITGIDTQQTIDPTASLRLYSWQFATEIIKDHPWIGVGYSRYAYEINYRGHGLLSGHASGGSDSSLLTIWATTGLFGFLSALAIGFVAVVTAFSNIWKKENFKSYLNAGLLAGLAGMFIHSVFVNSLLFPLMMVYLWVGLGLMDQR
ncbi:O-antigen ligase family protein [Candidatus Peregrinibacteria bacterium]|nr:O-antigen ligase family protein [Candidatus Peregrinibacteria bacterium]